MEITRVMVTIKGIVLGFLLIGSMVSKLLFRKRDCPRLFYLLVLWFLNFFFQKRDCPRFFLLIGSMVSKLFFT